MIDRTAEEGSSRGRLIYIKAFIPNTLPDLPGQDSGKILQFRSRNNPSQQNLEEDASPFNIKPIEDFQFATWRGHTTFTPGQVSAYERTKLLRGESDFIS